MGELSELRQLWLRDNQLTGSIPSELEELDLQHLHLSGNSAVRLHTVGVAGRGDQRPESLGA